MGPLPPVGAAILRGTVKMKVTHPVPRELWDWLVLSGWRNVPVKNDRRSYQWLPDAALKELLDADPAQRNQAHARVLLQSKADAELSRPNPRSLPLPHRSYCPRCPRCPTKNPGCAQAHRGLLLFQ